MLVYRKEVATVSQPPFPTVPPAGLPTTSTVGAKATVRASVDTRVVSGEEGTEGGEMRGALALPRSGRARVARSPRGWVRACGLVGSSAWSGGERKAVVDHPLTHAPNARPAAREAIAFLHHRHYSKGPMLQALTGKTRVGATTATRPP